MVLAWTGDELWCGQAQNGVNLDFLDKFDLEGESRSFHETTGILTKVFYISDPNMVILAWTGHELSTDKQVIDTQMDRHTHTRTQAVTIPEGQNWTQVKTMCIFWEMYCNYEILFT